MGKEVTEPPTEAEASSACAPTYASLVLIYGGELGLRHTLTGETTIGRDKSNTVAIDLKSVSRCHAKLFEVDGAWRVVDLQSTNGTFVNHHEVDGEASLVNGDLLKLGGAVMKFLEGGNVEALYHEEIHRLTILDGLTGIHNKRSFVEFLDREVARATRHDRPLSLVMMDVDDFKHVNDTHGHLAGDHVLQELARLISESMRRDELFARYGGDEFCFVLPETDLDQARLFCERIRRLTEAHVFRFDDHEILVTVSLGATDLVPGQGLDDFIATADALLYRAKQGGRNRVVWEAACPHDSAC